MKFPRCPRCNKDWTILRRRGAKKAETTTLPYKLAGAKKLIVQCDCNPCEMRFLIKRNELHWKVEPHSGGKEIVWCYVDGPRPKGPENKCVLVEWKFYDPLKMGIMNGSWRTEIVLPWLPFTVSKEDLDKYLVLL